MFVNKEGLLKLLQQLLTMVDKESHTSIRCAKNALENIYALARESGKSDAMTIRMMDRSIHLFERMVAYKEDFAGVPGDYNGNAAKRHHLEMMIRPGC